METLIPLLNVKYLMSKGSRCFSRSSVQCLIMRASKSHQFHDQEDRESFGYFSEIISCIVTVQAANLFE